MTNDIGRAPSGQALAVPVEPASGLAPSGFDPSRVEQIDRQKANEAFDIAFRGDTDGIDDAMAALLAEHRLLGEQRAIARIVNVATSHDEIAPFVAGKLPPCDFDGDWIRGDSLTWHAADGRVVSPRDSDGSGEAGETGTGSTEGDSAGPKDIAQGGEP